MAFAVNIYFDQDTEALLKKYWKRLDDANLPNKSQRAFRPHITLCIFEKINCSDCECYINEISDHFKIKKVRLDHLGIFNNGEKVLFLATAPSEMLLNMQKEIFKTVSQYAQQPWDLYHPAAWVPHCTMANDLDADGLKKALEITLGIHLPIQALVSQIGIIEFDPIHTIYQVDIKEH